MEQSWEGKIVKVTTGADYLLLHRIKHSNHLDLCLYLKMSTRLLTKNELKSHRLATALFQHRASVPPNEKSLEGRGETIIRLDLDTRLVSIPFREETNPGY